MARVRFTGKLQAGFGKYLKGLGDDMEKVRDTFLTDMSHVVVNKSESFVDTGAYIQSHTITTQSGGGRGYTSHNKPRKQDKQAMASVALGNLMSDIASLPDGVHKVYLTNRSPQSRIVEDKLGYAVFATARSLAPDLAREAILEVKASRA